MIVGERYNYNGLEFEVRREESEFSCEGCAFLHRSKKGEIGCLAKTNELSTCKSDHVILALVGGDRFNNFIERRRNLILNV